MGAIKTPSIITNIVANILALASVVRSIKFVYCNRHANTLVDAIVRKAYPCIAQIVSIYQ